VNVLAPNAMESFVQYGTAPGKYSGKTAAVKSEAKSPFEIVVGYVGALVDPATRATAVRIVTENTGRFLVRDMYVQVDIASRKARSGVLVPVSAVLRDAENLPFVFVAQADSSFARRSIGLGARVGDQYEITTGLSAGDHVIVEGGLFLQFAENQ
jgi:cobalt-zinc-cadmium efflux system membrane fusion protein